jgi:ABC-type phosphate transport system substrate-binding protein
MNAKSVVAISAGLFIAFALGSSPARAQRTVLVGSGSTVPAPLYTAWGAEYAKQNPKVQLRFVPVGTEEGIKEVSHSSGDFAAGEMPLSEKERSDDGLTELPHRHRSYLQYSPGP